MSVLGIVSEYNPFHNGHLLHLNESKKLTNSNYTVCVISGNFIQRGEPALIDKWSRAKMALRSGVDLVIELPVVYSLQSAELFAYGGIKILNSLGIIDTLCFGSESGNIAGLDAVASILLEEPWEYRYFLKTFLDEGLSFPQSRLKALNQMLDCPDLKNILTSPNNILGIEYLKAITFLRSPIVPFTIKRNNDYSETELTGNISSATSIRQTLLQNNNLDDIKENVPQTTFDILKEEFDKGCGPVFSKDFEQVILTTIRKMSIEEIKNIFDVNEGLENKIKKSASKANNLEELISLIKSKRYTQTRIQRILFHILLGIEKSFYEEASIQGGPQYIRVLGFNENGKKLLSTAKKKATLPIITKVADFKNNENETFNKMLQYDITATNLYTLAYKNPQYRVGDIDYTHEIIIEK